MHARPKLKRVKSRHRLRKWAKARSFCAVCGTLREGAWPPHQVHHLANGAGRSDEACALLCLCSLCHRLAHGERIRINGELLPKLTRGMLLAVKQSREPQEWDAGRLRELHGKPLPEMEALPDVFVEAWERNLKRRVPNGEVYQK